MHQSLFFKLFPPPKFLLMPHAGIDISDDAISFVEYSRPVGNRSIIKFGRSILDRNLIEGGDIKDEGAFISILSAIVRDYGLLYAKLSIPEEKAYLFETEIPYGDFKTIYQNIEFKLEQNIPISAEDAVFSFDLLPGDHTKPWRASVSAVPRTYIEHMISLFRKAGIIPIAFETMPRAISRVVSYVGSVDTIIVHVMDRKTGVYIVSEQAVGFTSTISTGSSEVDPNAYVAALSAEVRRVYTYWIDKEGSGIPTIKRVIVVGNNAERVALDLRDKITDVVPVEPVDVWRSILDVSSYVPPINKEDSFSYASAAGLAL
jgi:Tfp pilus assembly PilM family ATPase